MNKRLRALVMHVLPWYDEVAADIRIKRSLMLSAKAEAETMRARNALDAYRRMNTIYWGE